MQTISREEFEKKYGSEALTTPSKGFVSDAVGDIVETGKDIWGSLKEGGKEVAGGFMKSVRGERDPLKAGLDVAGSVVGTVSDVVGDVVMGVGKTVLPESVEKKIGESVKAGVASVADTQAVQSLVNRYRLLPEDRKQDLRTTGEFLSAALDMLGLKGASYLKEPVETLAKQGAKAVGEVATKGVEVLKKGADMAIDTTKGVIKPKKTVTQVVGEILQGETGDIKSGLKTLSNLDTKSVQTYDDLANTIKTRISSLSRGVDDVLDQDKSVTKLSKLVTEAKSASGKVVKTNYVEKALGGLQELYTKIDDGVRSQNIKDLIKKAKTVGLTKKEINNIAREYGQEFGSKAFSKLGDPLTSVNAQMFENVRKGVKSVARQGIGSEKAKQIDSLISDMYNTQTLVQKNVEAVNKIAQKIQERGLVEKVGWAITKGIDMASGGLVRGLVGGILPRGVGNKVFNAIDLEKRLKSNLKLINEAIEKGSDDALIDVANKLSN